MVCAAVFMPVQGAEGVMYIPLAPLSDMAVSVMVRIVLFVVGSYVCVYVGGGGGTAQAIIRRKARI